MPTYDITDHGNGHYSVRDTTYDEPVDMPGFEGLMRVSSIVTYLIAFVGMIIMLCNLPSTMIFPGILAMVLFLLPVLGAAIGKKSLASVFGAVAKYAYMPFNLMVGLWWLLWSNGTASEGLLIGLLVVTMYAMYYFPALLIYDGSQRETKMGVIGAVCCVVISLAVFLTMLALFENSASFGNYVPVMMSTTSTVVGTLFLMANRTVYLVREGAKLWRALLLPCVYVLAVGVIALFTFVVIPAQNAERYETAMQCIENGDYKQARALLLELGSYEDAAARYEEIRFVKLQVGERVTMGIQTDAPDDLSGENPITWTVVAVEDGKALLFCDAILTSIDAGSLRNWTKNNAARNALIQLEGVFSEDEQARLLPHTYTLQNEDGEEITVTDTLFLPGRAELEGYNVDIFDGADTTYNDHQVLDYQMADLDYTYIYAYYVRDTDESGEWIVADCDADGFVTRTRAHRYVGIRPAVYVALDEITE